MVFLGRPELLFFHFAKQQLAMMKNSINRSEDFFSLYFECKTEDEVIEWIEKEAQKW